ncbi:CAP domain-containing protein [Leucobacter zeae]|nr:CAP domain-containing protein [Leucobacter zeae]
MKLTDFVRPGVIAVTVALLTGTSLPANAVERTVDAAPGVAASNTVIVEGAIGGTKHFVDVTPSTTQFVDPSTWMLNTGLSMGETRGGKTYYEPNRKLNRGAMAAFMYRLAGAPAFTTPKRGFVDVPRSHRFHKPIMWMKAIGLSVGITTRAGVKFAPESSLTRGAMAAFLYRDAGTPKVSSSSGFVDVPRTHTFAKPITWMRQTGLSAGVESPSGLKYLPSSSTTRGAMAAFIYRKEDGKPMVESGKVRITGEAHVGEKVTAAPTGWNTANLSFDYRWKRDGVFIKNADANSYTLKAEDRGHKISVVVTGSRTDRTRVAVASPVFTPTDAPLPGIDGSLPVVSGKYETGTKLTVRADDWKVKPTFTWLLNGAAVGTGSSYTIPANAAGKKLAVRADAEAAGYRPKSMTTTPIAVTLRQIQGSAPTIQGEAVVTKTVSVQANGWTIAPTFTWLLNGSAMGTGSSFKIPADAAGKKLAVRATASAAGYETKTLTSSSSQVQEIPVTGVKPKIVGNPREGNTLSVSTTGWSVPPKVTWYEASSADKIETIYAYEIGTGSSYLMTGVYPGQIVYAVAEAGSTRFVSDPVTVLPTDDAKAATLLLQKINAHRQSKGIAALTPQLGLSQGADAWAQDITDTQRFRHSTVEWRAQWTPYTLPTGENIIQSCGSASPHSATSFADWATRAWLDSDDHRKNIELNSWNSTGLAVVTGSHQVVKEYPWGGSYEQTIWCTTAVQIFEARP